VLDELTVGITPLYSGIVVAELAAPPFQGQVSSPAREWTKRVEEEDHAVNIRYREDDTDGQPRDSVLRASGQFRSSLCWTTNRSSSVMVRPL